MKLYRLNGPRRGMVLVWSVLTMLLLVGAIGLALDTAFATLVLNQLQYSADASALAGAQWAKIDVADAREAAVNIGKMNTAGNQPVVLRENIPNLPDGDIVLGRYDRNGGLFTPTLSFPNALKAVARRTASSPNGALPTLFGRIFGTDTFDLERYAIAKVGGSTGAGTIVLAPDAECAFEIKGTILIDVDGGAVQVNSTDPCGACGSGTPLLITPALNVGGDPGLCATPGVEITGVVNPNSEPIPDPLAFLPDPTWDPADDLGTFVHTESTDITISAGYYSGGIKTLGGTVTLDPGIYILDGVGFEIGGNANVYADGVMLYIIGTGFIDVDGLGSIRITPPDPELYSFDGVGTYEGVSIFQARDNSNPSRIIGTSEMEITGSLYFPATRLSIGGIGGDFGNQLIAWELELHGTGTIKVGYNGNQNAPGNNLFLVE